MLARVIGLFSGRGYNIESLTVAEVNPKENLSRITIVTSGTAQIIEQIKAQLGRLVPVHNVSDLTLEGPHVERELALVTVKGTGEKRVEALRIGARSDTSGLAGGDHLHFGIFVGTRFVNPREWWDPHWIRDNVERKLNVTF